MTLVLRYCLFGWAKPFLQEHIDWAQLLEVGLQTDHLVGG
jgi:hypothetical protein